MKNGKPELHPAPVQLKPPRSKVPAKRRDNKRSCAGTCASGTGVPPPWECEMQFGVQAKHQLNCGILTRLAPSLYILEISIIAHRSPKKQLSKTPPAPWKQQNWWVNLHPQNIPKHGYKKHQLF